MGILSRLFGTCGKIRFEGETTEGQTFSGKCSIETFGMDKEEIEQKLKDGVYVETGKTAKSLCNWVML